MKNFSFIVVFLFFSVACKHKSDPKFNIAEFPKDWVQLTDKGKGLVVFNSCDMGNLLLSIQQKEGKPEILLHGTQEDIEYEVFEIAETGNDTVVFRSGLKGYNEKQDFKFIWLDKNKGTGRWVTTFSNGTATNQIFVTVEKQKGFTVVNQPCVECWGEECEEMESE